MEAANWDAANIHATSLKLGLRSEASARFEKGLAPEQALDGQAVATRLMLELTGARLVPGHGRRRRPRTRRRPSLRLRDKKVVGLLGVGITRSESAMHLQRLGFETAERPDGLDVTVPPWRRNDVTREADLIEEVARLHGVNDQLPATLPRRRGAVGVLTPAQRLRRRAEDVLVGRGLLRDRRLELRVARRATTACGCRRRRPAPRPRRHREPDERGRTRTCARRCSARCWTSRATTPRAGRACRASSSPAACTSRGPARRCRTSTTRSARSCPATSSPRRATSRRCCGALRVEATFASAPQPFLHPGRSAAVQRRRRRRSAGSATCTRSSRATGTSTASPRSRSTSTPSSPRRGSCPPTRT